MNRFTFTLPLLLCAALAFAEDPAKPAETPSAPATLYKLKNTSSFVVPAGSRVPFIPIGWVRRAGSTAVVAAQNVELDESAFRVTSVLLGSPALAVINGRSYEEGQFVRMPRTGPQVRVLVYRIRDGQVLLQVEGKVIPVELKRQELNERKTEESVLSEDRDAASPAPPPAPKTR
jgi:hypothetical protein